MNLHRRHGFAGLGTGARRGAIGRVLCLGAVILFSGRALLAQATVPRGPFIDSLAHCSVSSAQLNDVLRRCLMPLVEPLHGDSNHKLVTFVWHGDPATRNVVVVTPLTLIDFGGSVMTRLNGTDLWYRSFSLPARTTRDSSIATRLTTTWCHSSETRISSPAWGQCVPIR